MRTLRGTRVLVTGGASGIGKCMARAFLAEGAEVLIADLNGSAASATAAELAGGGGRARGYACDVTDPDSIATLRARVLEEGAPIDVLVNNAGVVFGGAFLEVPLERHIATYRVNTVGPVAMTHAFLPDLIERPDAHIVNVASASGYIGLPFGTTYASSKWAVIGFSESLALELELQGNDHVQVTSVCPSYVATGMFDGVRPPIGTQLLTPEHIAAHVVRAVLAKTPVVRLPWVVKVTPLLKALLPARTFARVMRSFGVSTSMMHWRGRAVAAPATGTSGDDQPPAAVAGGH